MVIAFIEQKHHSNAQMAFKIRTIRLVLANEKAIPFY